MINPFKKRKPVVVHPQMSDEDKKTIIVFATSNKGRAEAIDAYNRNLSTIGTRGNLYQQFMSEIVNPAPDYVFRKELRDALVRYHYQPEEYKY